MSDRAGQLLEREEALVAVGALLGSAGVGTGSALLVEGSAGIGKTSVLEHALARARGGRVLQARGVELERGFPFGVARQLLLPALQHADARQRSRWAASGALDAERVLRGVANATDEAAGFNALYWLVVALAAEQRLVLVVDDLHWCDDESLRWLGFLVRRMEDVDVALLMATRPHEAAASERALEVLRDDGGVQRIVLGPLSNVAARTLLESRLGATDHAFLAACEEATGGNPFLLRELLVAIADADLVPDAAHAGRVASLASTGLQRTVIGRIAALGNPAREVARAVALLGARPSLAAMAGVAELPLDETATAARDLVDAEILRDGANVDFRHPLLRAAVLAELGGPLTAAGHVRAARVLLALDAPAEAVAAQLLSCDPLGEEWAGEVLERAAADAQAHASAAPAARLLERALREPVDAERRSRLEAALAGALIASGDEHGIEALHRARAATADPLQRAALSVRLSVPTWFRGSTAEAIGPLEDARRATAAGPSELAFAIAAGRAAGAGVGSGEPIGPLLDAALALVPDGDGVDVRGALALLCGVALSANRPAHEVAALARRALGDAAAHERAIEAGFAMPNALGVLTFVEDDTDVAAAFARIEARVAWRGGIAFGPATFTSWRALGHLHRGALLDAVADAEAGLARAPANSFALLRTLAAIPLTAATVERGDPTRALTLADAQLGANRAGASLRDWLALQRARALHALGRSAEAVAETLEIGARAIATEVDPPALLPWRRVAAEGLIAQGENARAAQLAHEEVALAERFGAPGPLGCALRTVAVSERDLDGLRAAEQTLSGSVMRLEHARALVELGAALRRDRQRAAAREPLAAGMELAHRCGAVPLVARADEELRASGARPRSIVRSGRESLTPSELRTARLAASGLTNREIAQRLFVSRKTVETQLGAAYRKLDVAGRAELATALGD